MTETSTLRIDSRRLWDSIMTMAGIGATPGGGVGRIALTDLDGQARDLFVSWCEAAELKVRVDRVGNVFARRQGVEPDAAPVMTGSHLDTQPLGGKFDGIYGVLAGLEVTRTLNDAGLRTKAPLDLVVWTDEEGVRFNGMPGSGAFAGVYDPDSVLARTDRDGVRFADALAAIGYAGTEPVGQQDVDCLFEAHIEQGPILETSGNQVGVVTGAQGQRCFQVTVAGEEGHAGTLPMHMRKDAMLGAARMVDALNRIAFEQEPVPVITVGRLLVRPNSPNTIPGQVVFSIDSRHPDDVILASIHEEMQKTCETIAAELGLGISFDLESERKAVKFHDACVSLIRETASRLGISHQDMHSGAGHDACQLVHETPTGMIFVPCESGISHNEQENARPEDLAAGCNVLLHAMLARAGVTA